MDIPISDLFGFNRTFMELKHVEILAALMISFGFNRTFMELKQTQVRQNHQKMHRFNRTFMELKPMTNVLQVTFDNIVLIGPSWN